MSNHTTKDLEKKPRSGEELNLEVLLPWMQSQGIETVGEPVITQFSGGASNWTYRLQFVNKELILRRAPLGKKAAGAHDMPREYELQKAIKPFYRYVPQMLAVCKDEDVLGSTFYVMEKIDGLIPRKNLPIDIDWKPDLVKSLCESFWDKMIELHQVDYKTHGLDHLGKGEGYVERQIAGWNKRYAAARTWNVPSGNKVMKWLEQHLPKQENLCIIHNDFRLDNVVLDAGNPANIVGVLDWELAAIGDPLMDLGSSLAYWVHADDNFFIKSMRRQPSNAQGMLRREEVINYYALKTGTAIDDFRFYRIYGLFRLAGIAQQIYYRYSKGFTKNKAFKNFWMISIYLIKTCENVMKQKR